MIIRDLMDSVGRGFYYGREGNSARMLIEVSIPKNALLEVFEDNVFPEEYSRGYPSSITFLYCPPHVRTENVLKIESESELREFMLKELSISCADFFSRIIGIKTYYKQYSFFSVNIIGRDVIFSKTPYYFDRNSYYDIKYRSLAILSGYLESIEIHSGSKGIFLSKLKVPPITRLKDVIPEEKLTLTSVVYAQFSKDLDNASERLERLQYRYSMVERPRTSLRNVVCDSFVPKWFASSGFNLRDLRETLSKTLPTTAKVISRNFSQLLGIKAIPMEQLCRMVGYDKKSIKSLLSTVKKKRLNIAFLGIGGTGMNTVHWLTEMCEMVNIFSLFNEVTIFEDDRYTFDNMLRFPAPLNDTLYTKNHYTNIRFYSKKIALLTPRNTKALTSRKEFTLIDRKFNPNDYKKKFYPTYNNISGRRAVAYREGADLPIFYGAPDIETREGFTHIFRKGFKLITATHSGNSCSIRVNSLMEDSALMEESYGLLQLNVFFMNQLRMSIGFLELLASDDLDERLNEIDIEYLKYSYCGEKQAIKTDTKYNVYVSNKQTIQTTQEMQDEWR